MPRARKKNEEALGRSRGGFGTKIHVAVDAVGAPIKLLFTPGQESDISHGPELIAGCGAAAIIADRGYDGHAFIDAVIAEGAKPVIPSRSIAVNPRKTNRRLYRKRNRVERFINRIKHYRRVATRYEKTVRNFSAIVHCAAALILLG